MYSSLADRRQAGWLTGSIGIGFGKYKMNASFFEGINNLPESMHFAQRIFRSLRCGRLAMITKDLLHLWPTGPSFVLPSSPLFQLCHFIFRIRLRRRWRFTLQSPNYPFQESTANDMVKS